jgi:dihydrofolate reductase
MRRSHRDIRIAGGADTIQQYLRVGLVDDFTLATSPVMFGGGRACSRTSAATSASSWWRPSRRRACPACATPCAQRVELQGE